MEVTIKDIAADAGVSVSTVSRVMNDSKSVEESYGKHRKIPFPPKRSRPKPGYQEYRSGSSTGSRCAEPNYSNPFETDQRGLYET